MDGSHVFEKDVRSALFQKLAAKGLAAQRGPKRHVAGSFQMDGNHVFEKPLYERHFCCASVLSLFARRVQKCPSPSVFQKHGWGMHQKNWRVDFKKLL